MGKAVIVLTSVSAMRSWSSERRNSDHEIGLVPTMGYLHAGHLSLVKRAREANAGVVASIFVNPTQFGPNEDLARYPRDFEGDFQKLESSGVDALFYPEPSELYPGEFQTFVEVQKVSVPLCGAFRPGHFRGVATVVLKLFNIVAPTRAYFGQKDYQQLQVIRTMVRDLNVDVEVIGCQTVREADGLAMSSRNSYLNQSQRQQAVCLYDSMRGAKHMFDGGECSPSVLLAHIERRIEQEPDTKIEYVKIVDSLTLREVDKVRADCLIALAVNVGATRLIDNMMLGA